MTTKAQYLVISALGKDRPGIINKLTAPFTEQGCNIIDTRMTVLGGEFAILMLVHGSWSALAKLEGQMETMQEKLGLTILCRRTEKRPDETQSMPYNVNVVALDHPGIVNQLAGFFSARNINIEDLYTDSYRAPHTGTPMFSANMTIGIPANQSIARLRDEFMDFCDGLNLDGVLEPLKN